MNPEWGAKSLFWEVKEITLPQELTCLPNDPKPAFEGGTTCPGALKNCIYEEVTAVNAKNDLYILFQLANNPAYKVGAK